MIEWTRVTVPWGWLGIAAPLITTMMPQGVRFSDNFTWRLDTLQKIKKPVVRVKARRRILLTKRPAWWGDGVPHRPLFKDIRPEWTFNCGDMV